MDAKTIEIILNFLCDELGGDWLLTGGALVRLKFDENRGTEDLDLVRIRHDKLSDEASRDLLFRWLIERGMGPEWVNAAVEPFVRDVADWKNELVALRSGARGAVFRPNFTFFTYLKLRRGSEVDILDIKKAKPKCPEGFDQAKFMSWADQELKVRFRKFRRKLDL